MIDAIAEYSEEIDIHKADIDIRKKLLFIESNHRIS